MENDVIIIPSENEIDEKLSFEESLKSPLAFNEKVFEYIDSLQSEEILREEILKLSGLRMKTIFWESFKKFFAEKSLTEKRRAILKCSYVNRYFGSLIPLNRNINRFTTPHHFYGIFISEGAVIGKGCTIFQHVTIGSNTLLDSKSAGTPVIGNNVYIGAGAKIIGNVKIGNNVRIGAGCTVVKDVPDNCTVAQAAPIIIQKTNPQNNRWLAYGDYKKIKAEENARRASQVLTSGGDIFSLHQKIRHKMCIGRLIRRLKKNMMTHSKFCFAEI